jgi:hypothetical protein
MAHDRRLDHQRYAEANPTPRPAGRFDRYALRLGLVLGVINLVLLVMAIADPSRNSSTTALSMAVAFLGTSRLLYIGWRYRRRTITTM